jgi:hypothetical protein
MEGSAYIGEGIAGLLFLIAGVRLLWLALRTGKAPEWLMSAGFLAWGLSYFLCNLPYALADESLLRPFYSVGRFVSAMGAVAFALFTWRVFRQNDIWGLWVVAGTTVCLIAGVVGSVWVGDWEGVYPIRNPWWWPEWTGATATEAWLAAEALVQYGKARQRLRLGLGDPLRCNGFLLLGLASLLWLALEFVVVAQSIEHEITQRWSAGADILVAGVEVVAIAMIWLFFFPPAFYSSWINGAAPVAKAVKG